MYLPKVLTTNGNRYKNINRAFPMAVYEPFPRTVRTMRTTRIIATTISKVNWEIIPNGNNSHRRRPRPPYQKIASSNMMFGSRTRQTATDTAKKRTACTIRITNGMCDLFISFATPTFIVPRIPHNHDIRDIFIIGFPNQIFTGYPSKIKISLPFVNLRPKSPQYALL